MTSHLKTKFLEFKSALSPNNHEWYYVKRTNDTGFHDSAIVITTLVKIDGRYNFLLLKTKRPPLYAENKAQFCLESPAGLIGDNDKNETALDCAKKELLEETGLCADKIFLELQNSAASSGLSSETLTFVSAFVQSYNIISKPLSDGGIIAERIFVPEDKILNFINETNPKELSVASACVCGIFFALQRLNSLQK